MDLGAEFDERLATGLAAASLGLGAVLLVTPGPVARLAGIEEDGATRTWQRLVGLRELLACGLIAVGGPRPSGAVWFRAGGDAKDLVLLGLAARSKRQDSRRLALASTAIGTIAALDVYAAIRLSRQSSTDPGS
jgi:hypothetical protein